ncbi:MAG: CTP synthase, partial [Methanobacterium paludis]|nr:CTP synthase [Methanobacterium paludis]
MESRKPDLYQWSRIVDALKIDNFKVTVGIVGKYVELEDAYISIREALKHAAANQGVKVDIEWIRAEESLNIDRVKEFDALLIPGGFGERGISGKLEAVKYSIESKIPLFGICLGMQCMVIEFARMHGFEGANSTEFDENAKHPVIHIMKEQKYIKNLGGTMRLGAYPCKLKEGTIAHDAYKEDSVSERHRHRFEFNNDYRQIFEDKGLIISGKSPDDLLVEIIELEGHPWFLGCQFHPEFKSRPNNAHPLFVSFIKAAIENKKRKGI